MARVKRAKIDVDATPEEEEAVITKSSAVILDKQIKAELNYAFIISNSIYKVTEAITKAAVDPTMANVRNAVLSMKVLSSVTHPYHTDRYIGQEAEHIRRINTLNWFSKDERYEILQEVADWLSDFMDNLSRVGMLFKENIAGLM